MSKLKDKVAELEKENKSLKKYIEELENRLNSKVKNERNAGRKKKLSDEEIEQIKMYRLQNKTIKELSKMFNVSVGLIHKILNDSTIKSTPPDIKPSLPTDEPIEKIAKIEMYVRIENNNTFVRGKGKVRESVERYLKWDYKMEKPDPKGWEYILYVPYTTIEDLEKTIYEIMDEIDSEADFRN